MISVDAQIEAILFVQSKPLSREKLVQIIGLEADVVDQAIAVLDQRLSDRGIVLLHNDGKLSLATHPDTSEIIQSIRKAELTGELSRAALETLTIVLYQPGITKTDLDYIRGVNSQFTLRALIIRGLIAKHTGEDQSRTVAYRPTFALLEHLGIRSVDQLPEYGEFTKLFDELEYTETKS